MPKKSAAKKRKGRKPAGKKRKKPVSKAVPRKRTKARKRKPAKKAVPRKKAKARKRKPAKKILKQVERVSVERTVTGRRRKRTKAKAKPKSRRRSVSGKGGSSGLLMGLAIGGGLYLLLSSMNKQTPTTQYPAGYYGNQLQYTGNTTRDQQSQAVINYAIAAGYAVSAIASLVDLLNGSDDNQVNNVYNQASTTGDLGNWV